MRRQATGRILETLEAFSRRAAPRMLRPYQLEAGEAIVRSILRGEGGIFTILMARQSGKNELAAQLEAYLLNLYADRGGQIVKAAPSYHPQIVNSVIRLREVLSTPFSAGRWVGRHGHSIELGRARIMFFSADPAANVVGATASILLEIDEAQDVDAGTYWRSFRPMASTTGATTILYGTAWDDDNLLEQQRRHNRRLEATTGQRRNFEAPWTVLARLSPAYAAFVQGEIDRLGEDHPVVRTQFFLEPVSAGGRLFPPSLLSRLHGDHGRHRAPREGAEYIAGVDVAGQIADLGVDGKSRALNQRDDTVVTIMAVDPDGNADSLPRLRVVEHYRWQGLSHAQQYERLERLLAGLWNVRRAAVDATGIGAGLASFLLRSQPTRIEPFVFSSRSKSDLGFGLLAAAETGRLTVYRDDNNGCLEEFWAQLAALRYRLRDSELLEFSAPAGGHDDFVMSLALAVRAAERLSPPAFGGLVRSQPGPGDRDLW